MQHFLALRQADFDHLDKIGGGTKAPPCSDDIKFWQ